MEALRGIIWFLATLISIALIFELFRIRNHALFFPETRRWWHTPFCLAALAFFALMVLSQPFGHYTGIL